MLESSFYRPLSGLLICHSHISWLVWHQGESFFSEVCLSSCTKSDPVASMFSRWPLYHHGQQWFVCCRLCCSTHTHSHSLLKPFACTFVTHAIMMSYIISLSDKSLQDNLHIQTDSNFLPAVPLPLCSPLFVKSSRLVFFNFYSCFLSIKSCMLTWNSNSVFSSVDTSELCLLLSISK